MQKKDYMYHQYKTLKLCNILVGKQPKCQIVEATTIVKQCLLIPYHAARCHYILIKIPADWSNKLHNLK